VWLSCAVAVAVTQLQIMGVYDLLAVKWPFQIKTQTAGVSKIFSMDLDMISIDCITGSDPMGKYIFSVIALMSVFLGFFVLMFPSRLVPVRLLPKFLRENERMADLTPWKPRFVLNAMGSYNQMVFITLSTISMIPFTCFPHPNGQASVLRYQGILCNSDQQRAMGGVGIFLMLFITTFYSVIVYLACIAPGRTQKDPKFLYLVRFLVFKYRLDRWWWCCVPIPRGLCVSLVPVIAANDARVQLVYLLIILGCYTIAVVQFNPWKAPLINFMDAVTSALLMQILIFAKSFLPSSSKLEDFNFDWAMFGCCMVVYGFCAFTTAGGAILQFRFGGMGVLSGKVLGIAHMDSPNVNAATLAPNLIDLSKELIDKYGAHELEAVMSVWQYDDLRKVKDAIDMMYSYNLISHEGKKVAPRVFFNTNLTDQENLKHSFDKVGIASASSKYESKSNEGSLGEASARIRASKTGSERSGGGSERQMSPQTPVAPPPNEPPNAEEKQAGQTWFQDADNVYV
jgi:hypothetical protein